MPGTQKFKPPRSLVLVLLVALWYVGVAEAHPLGPNRFLGTCLDTEWVERMEQERGVSNQDRDPNGHLTHPFLQPALKHPRYTVDDPRTASEMAFSDNCMESGTVFYGADQDDEGSTQGEVAGTLVLDMNGWDTHALSTMVLAILAEEVVGYKVSLSVGGSSSRITERMSSVKSGVCMPTHLNTEVWTSTTMASLRTYLNESYSVGSVGYHGTSGLYVSRGLVEEGVNSSPPYFADFWRSYKTSEELIDALSVTPFKANSKYYPPAEDICPDDTMGCRDNCQKTEACSRRENAGKECLVVAMMYPSFDRGYFQAVLSNLDIPAYFCFIGYQGVDQYASDAASSGEPALFYHYEPDLFHVTQGGHFDRVLLPRAIPERVKLATGDFGEHGYGQKTDNPVDVDYPSLPLLKFAASIVEDLPIGSLFARFTLSDMDIHYLLREYSDAKSDSEQEEPYFRAACNWVKDNYDIWTEWVDQLPLCTFEEHVVTRVIGCEGGSNVRQIEFRWKSPNPENPLLPYDCDGGMMFLPANITTTRSCDWIRDNYRAGSGWDNSKPTCDSSFYDYNVSACESNGYQTIRYYWKLPDAANARLSAECTGGDTLPDPSRVKCEFGPRSVQNCTEFCGARQNSSSTRGTFSGSGDHWLDINVAFVNNLPRSPRGFDSVVVIMERMSGRARFVPTSSTASVTDMACLFCIEQQQVHGLPRSIVLDQNIKFTSSLQKGLMQFSKALTPSSDGSADAVAFFIAEYLRFFLRSYQDNWEDYLQLGEDIYNSRRSSAPVQF